MVISCLIKWYNILIVSGTTYLSHNNNIINHLHRLWLCDSIFSVGDIIIIVLIIACYLPLRIREALPKLIFFLRGNVHRAISCMVVSVLLNKKHVSRMSLLISGDVTKGLCCPMTLGTRNSKPSRIWITFSPIRLYILHIKVLYLYIILTHQSQYQHKKLQDTKTPNEASVQFPYSVKQRMPRMFLFSMTS